MIPLFHCENHLKTFFGNLEKIISTKWDGKQTQEAFMFVLLQKYSPALGNSNFILVQSYALIGTKFKTR